MTKVQAARAARVAALIAALVGFAQAASAQRPSEEQIAAIRQACRSDFIAHCVGVTPGGPQALACLREHLSDLSATCQQAINAAAPAVAPPAPAPAAAPAAPAPAPAPAAAAAPSPAAAALVRMRPTVEQLGVIFQACAADIGGRCANADRGPGWELKCLRDNAADLSQGCEQVLTAVAAGTPPAPAAAPPPPPAAAAPPPPVAAAPAPAAAPPAAPPPAAAQPGRPTRAQLRAIILACGGDVREHCADVEPRAASRIECLKDNRAALSSGCQAALAAVVSGAPAEPIAGPAAPSTAPPAAAPRPERRVSPREVLVLLRTACNADFRNYCGGVDLGGGRVIRCLRENAANLSPRCREAFTALIGGQ